MKNLIIMLKHIFVPLSAFSFLVLGLLACFCSAIIEFFVLKELLEVPELSITSDSWAMMLVLILEGSKLTLHFYSEMLKKAVHSQEPFDFDVKQKYTLVRRVKNGLVIFSLVCSLICIVNVLYHNNEEKITAALEENRIDCEEQLALKKEELSRDKAQAIAEGENTYANSKAYIEQLKDELALKEIEIANEPYIKRREDLMKEAAILRDEIAELTAAYETNITQVKDSAEADYRTSLAKYEALYGENGTYRLTENDAKIQAAGNNSYLSNFLLALSRTFFGTTYSQTTYFLISLLLAFTVSLILELCISISQMLLTLSVESFVKLIGEIPKLVHGKNFVRITVWLMFSTLIATAVYLVASILFGISENHADIRLVVLTYLFIIGLVNITTMKHPKGNIQNLLESKFDKTEILFSGLQTVLTDMLIPATLCFVGYSLIGFVCNGNFVYGDMNGLAIAVGGAFAKIVKFDQCTLRF